MARIQKAPETMTSRERVIRTFQYEKTDRVTIGYECNPGIDQRLKTALGARNHEKQKLNTEVKTSGFLLRLIE